MSIQQHILRLGAGVVIAGLGTGLQACAYSKDEGKRLESEVYALQTQVTAMQQSLTELQGKEKAAAGELEKANKELAELSKVARRNNADLGVQLEEMMSEVRRLLGRVESYEERLSSLEVSNRRVVEEVDVRFQGLADKQKIDRAATDEEKQRAIEETRGRERLLGDPAAVFAEAERMIAANRAGEARKLLRELTVRWADNKAFEKHGPQAQYLLGETFFGEGNFQQAAAEYNTVRKKFPSSPWVANALYKLGQCFERLNLLDDAKLFYRTVVEKHKKAAVVKDAQARLRALQ